MTYIYKMGPFRSFGGTLAHFGPNVWSVDGIKQPVYHFRQDLMKSTPLKTYYSIFDWRKSLIIHRLIKWALLGPLGALWPTSAQMYVLLMV